MSDCCYPYRINTLLEGVSSNESSKIYRKRYRVACRVHVNHVAQFGEKLPFLHIESIGIPFSKQIKTKNKNHKTLQL